MANFTVRSHNNQNFTLVDPANYKHVITGTQATTTSRYGNDAIDQFRHRMSFTNSFAVKGLGNCEGKCATVRDEALSISFIIAAGQEPAYYTAKNQQLKEAASVLSAIAAGMDGFKVGKEVASLTVAVA